MQLKFLFRIGCLAALLLAAFSFATQAQFSPFTGPRGATRTDTAGKAAPSDWENADAYIYYTRSFSEQKFFPDTSVHTIHRRPFSQPWYRDLGNLGSPAFSMLFNPKTRVGPSFGYYAYENVRYDADSLVYYNTTRPYSVFTYNLGSKQEQAARILHTQNIKPYWNVAINYRKLTSPGFYLLQRSNDDNAWLSTNYRSPKLHYQLFAAVVYNREQRDENGGIVSDTFLNNDQYADRKTIPVNFFNSTLGVTRSPVQTRHGDFSIKLQHAYAWGKKDTTYNKDSTKYEIKLNSRFRLRHTLNIGVERFYYKDKAPDSARYAEIFAQAFAVTDSVFMRQEHFFADNTFLLEGLAGKAGRQWIFTAGAGIRYDKFADNYVLNTDKDEIASNYLVGSFTKEAAEANAWAAQADARLFVTGAAAGNFLLQGNLNKGLGSGLAALQLGFKQQLANAPYSYTSYRNNFFGRSAQFDKESSTQLFGTLSSAKYNASVTLRNHLLANYFYFDQTQSPAQYASAFSILQLAARKLFRVSIFTLDNEFFYQQKSNAAAPVNVPTFAGRHQLAVETKIFGKRLQISTGLELRYHSAYEPYGYSPFFGRFYVQNTYRVANAPDGSVFFNFKVKRFRAYLMMDQVPQMFNGNILITRGYAAQNAAVRFGFDWVLIN